MKKHSSLIVLILSLLALDLVAQESEKDRMWALNADLQVHTVYKKKPSAQRDESAFMLPELELDFALRPEKSIELYTRLTVKDSREQVPPGSKARPLAYLELGYMSVKDIAGEYLNFDYGLISNTWILLEQSSWKYEYLGTQSEMLLEKTNYLAVSDLGMKFWGEVGQVFEWSLQFSNGEGLMQDEVGPKKDAQLVLILKPIDSMTFALGYLSGTYDNIQSETAHKERILGLVTYSSPWGLNLGVEYFQGKDPVDAINSKVADQVNLTDYGGDKAFSKGYAAFYEWLFGRANKISIFGKFDWVNPMQNVDKVDYRTQLLGIGFFPRRYLQFSFAFSDVVYGDLHNTSIRDTQQWVFGGRLQF